MAIEIQIQNWDGKSSDDIQKIYADNYQDKDFLNSLVRLIQKTAIQKGASWLLKAWLEKGNPIDKEQIETIYGELTLLQDWESKLHVLQSIPYMPIPDKRKNQVETFLRDTLQDRNKFVRAWSYNGFYELACLFPEYQRETEEFLEMAMRDEAPSVKARVRKLIKKGF